MKYLKCPFCDSKQAYRYILESKNVRVIYPKAPGCKYHTLVTPKRHVAHFDELTSDEALELHELIKLLVQIAKKNIPDFIGYNILSNNGGPDVRQRVQHAHIHLFLRTAYDKSDPTLVTHTGKPVEFTDADKDNMQKLQDWVSGIKL